MTRQINIKFIQEVIEKTQQAIDEGYTAFWDEEIIPFTTIDEDFIMLGNVCLVEFSNQFEDMADLSLAHVKVELSMRLKLFKEIKLW